MRQIKSLIFLLFVREHHYERMKSEISSSSTIINPNQPSDKNDDDNSSHNQPSPSSIMFIWSDLFDKMGFVKSSINHQDKKKEKTKND